MTKYFRSSLLGSHARGLEFGKAHAQQIHANIAIYLTIFKRHAGAGFDGLNAGNAALAATKSFAPELHDEMVGMAEGSSVVPALIGMLNARTEILAMLKASTRGECSTVIHVPTDERPPTAVQTWDWYLALKDSWLVWEIPLPDGSTTKTMTEYGIVGKSGMNTRGLGLLFTILHHKNDGRHIGVPVHVVARWLLDTAHSISRAAQLAATANVSASSSLNLVSYEQGVAAAISVELHPEGPSFVLPQANGVLIHTNHFLAPDLAQYDTEPTSYPDTLLRHDLLTRRMAVLANIDSASVLNVMASHAGGSEAVCCHHNSNAPPPQQYETLSTVVIDFSTGTLNVHTGGPCSHPLSHQVIAAASRLQI